MLNLDCSSPNRFSAKQFICGALLLGSVFLTGFLYGVGQQQASRHLTLSFCSSNQTLTANHSDGLGWRITASDPSVPDPFYVHYIRFKSEKGSADPVFSFLNYLSVKSALLYVKPDGVLVHGDLEPTGPYWEELKLTNRTRYVPRTRSTKAGNKKLAFVEHSADMAKLEVLLEYGGVSIDFDVYFVRGERIKEILQNKHSIACYDNADSFNIGFVAGRKDSKLVWAWRQSYNHIYRDEWVFNQAYVGSYVGALFHEETYIVDHVCNNPAWSTNMKEFFNDNGKIIWKNSIAVHTYSRGSGVPINNPADLGGTLTTYKELLLTIYENRTLPPVDPSFKDKIEPVLTL